MPSEEPTPGAEDAFRRLSEEMRAVSEKLRRAFASPIAPTLERWSLQLPKFDDWAKQLRPALERWPSAWAEALPPNWEGFSMDEVTDAIDRTEKTGYCLVWIPRIEIVREIMAVDVSETSKTLLARRDDVLDDCLTVLGDVTDPGLALERDAAGDAIRAFRGGHGKAAQALAASVFASTIHLAFQTGKFGKIRDKMTDKHPDDAVIGQLRLRTIYLATARALDDFRPETARPIRREFNRHNTAHRITPEQWTDANALRAVMLVTALLRELDF